MSFDGVCFVVARWQLDLVTIRAIREQIESDAPLPKLLFQPAQEIVRDLRVERGAELARDQAHLLHQVAPPDDRSAEMVAVAVEELGGGVHHQICAERERALDRGRREGRVDQRDGPARPAY